MKDVRTIKEKAKEYFKENDFDREKQSLISLFLYAIKTSNALILSKTEYQIMDWNVYKNMQSQFFKDTQLAFLLLKATEWSFDPMVYLKAGNYGREIWQKANLNAYLTGCFEKDVSFFRFLALSHALKTEIRFVPLIPSSRELNTPFLSTIYDIEIENGKAIQTQVALLKYMELPITLEEKEEIVRKERETVSEIFADFISELIRM
ncbi:MAG TPA: hypothetical protein DHW82_14185 [Spirochaetia bacterium]|nr:MAG: hypothetical protein A2Y41_00115 [Spirochaetes bacterium GWB1_36_13]HCL58139.1 hypothetical protein [Spirochaetia bacterium]